jgi:hypothetical protein
VSKMEVDDTLLDEEEELAEAWEFWYQRSTKMESLLYNAVVLYDRARAVVSADVVVEDQVLSRDAERWAKQARKALRRR